jgi:pimeloyl-ACP methyl ester carboxylesterase
LKALICLLSFFCCTLCQAQRDTINDSSSSYFDLKISYNSSLIYPGISVGTEFPFNHINVQVLKDQRIVRSFTKGRFISGDINWYHHPEFHDNIYLTVEWVMRRTSYKGFISEFSVGPGYSRTFLGATTYRLDDKGNISINKLAGYNYALITIGGGLGYDFSMKKQLPFSAFAKLNVISMFPYNSTIYFRPVLELGMRYTPGSSINKAGREPITILFSGCQKEKITISENASEAFYVENAGASMRVLVQGNTSGKIFILVIHGGPGVSAYFYDTKYIGKNLGDKCAMVYWDQRNAGASQGTSNWTDLHLDQMVDDLKKVIEVLRYRYGQDISLFLLGHSFGGLITADFITKPGYQNMIKGVIYVDGSHNYPLNDTLTRQMLLTEGQYQISQKKNVDEWQPIISYCTAHKGNFSLEESQQLEKYSTEAENYIDSINHISIVTEVIKYAIPDKYPLTAILSNLLYSEDSNFNKELAVSNFSSSLKIVTVPVLILWGKYDFTCPLALGKDFYNHINSFDKSIAISPQSGHNMILQDKKFFCNEVSKFVLRYRK